MMIYFATQECSYVGILYFSYSVRSGQTRNVEAARVSMPGQVKKLVYNGSFMLIIMFHSIIMCILYL